MKCVGIPSDGSTSKGKCNSTAHLPGEGADCSAAKPCGADLICAGQEIWGSGNCVPSWMAAALTGNGNTAIPDDGTTVSDAVVVYGLATVPVDIVVQFEVSHPRPADLKITLTDPNGWPSVLWDQAASSGPDLNRRIVGVSNPLDDQVNGRWTLSVADLTTGVSGSLKSWSLALTSRWD